MYYQTFKEFEDMLVEKKHRVISFEKENGWYVLTLETGVRFKIRNW